MSTVNMSALRTIEEIYSQINEKTRFDKGDQMSRFVRDSHAFSLLFTRPANWDVALLLTVRLQFWNACFRIWHLSNGCVEKAVRLSSGRGGAGCLIMSFKQERGRRLRARPPTKNNANQVGTAPACSTRHGRKGRKARLVQLGEENAATTKTGKLSSPGWNQCKASLGKFCEKFAWVIFSFHMVVNTTWNDKDKHYNRKNNCSPDGLFCLIVHSQVC